MGAAQCMLALIVNFWDALDRKREMPIIPTAPEVHYRDSEGQVWDLAIWVAPQSVGPGRFGGHRWSSSMD